MRDAYLLRFADDMVVVFDHLDHRHRNQLHSEAEKLPEPEPEESPRFSVTGKGFQFFADKSCYEAPDGEICFEGRGRCPLYRINVQL